MKTRKEKYHEYLKTPAWEELREFAKFRNRYRNNGLLKCDDCGKTDAKQYDVHHNEYPVDLRDDNPKYHSVLCHRCHGIRHDKIELDEKEQKEIEDREHGYMKNVANAILEHYES